MSKAFTRESETDGVAERPEREISSFINLVTPEGFAAIDAEVDRHSRLRAEAMASGDDEAAARAARDLRYWTARRNTAQVAAMPGDDEEVRFGSTVTILREDGRENTWRIVGEDEADPATGTLSHASPLARALVGKSVGDMVEAGATRGEVTKIQARR
jgi:transcription elongation GreA/GreB family factor